MRDVSFYRTASGHSPVENFLDKLTDVQVEASYQVIRALREEERIGTHLLRKLTVDIWELRVRSGGQQIRYLGFYDGRTLVVLTSGFLKKTRRTPRNEITTAESRRKDHLERHRDG